MDTEWGGAGVVGTDWIDDYLLAKAGCEKDFKAEWEWRRMAVASAGLKSVLVMNLATVGSFAVPIGLIAWISKREQNRSFWVLLVVGIACFVGAVLVAILL